MLKRERLALALLSVLALVATAAFLGLNLRGDLAFALELRGVRLLALVLVAVAVAASTVTFQTVTANRILTPAIMGLDALYAFGQTALVFGLGAHGFAALDPRLKFAGESALMLGMALALFLPLLRARMDVTLMLLSGVVLGVLFRSLSALLIRLVDPTAFAAIQGATFASFNVVRSDLLAIAGVVTVVSVAAIWRARRALDVLALGADPATGLGLDWRRSAVGLLALTALLVAVSTALVGPVVFLGLFVVAVAERLVDTRRHAVLLPAAVLVGVVVLVGGQALLQHGLGGEGALGIVAEFLGGVVFLAFLISEARR
ncbi:iron chelate uptake ABC transporter family permease subunit [Methylopila sp. 73B]|uniref:iron chelate uptake ABC transporter family permease subunit n=1 Tax=Methylopila sp. 73B TaxID=1120792 RepID=UPI00037122BE|nr:iron chelate uptake ABC transporter family permease subunit [Methylopila sp. 73B]